MFTGFMNWLRSGETEVWEALIGAPGPQTLKEISVSVGTARHIKKMARRFDPDARPEPASLDSIALSIVRMKALGWITESRKDESFGEGMITKFRYVLNANGQKKRRGVVYDRDDAGRPTNGPRAA